MMIHPEVATHRAIGQTRTAARPVGTLSVSSGPDIRSAHRFLPAGPRNVEFAAQLAPDIARIDAVLDGLGAGAATHGG